MRFDGILVLVIPVPYIHHGSVASSLFRSCGMMLIWPWVRVEANQDGYLEHANMIVFIMKKSDLADEIDHSCSIYMKQLIFDFIHVRKETEL